jgi:GntR family transcriptional repressor for pyruvate dehydrogenase complex
MSYAIRAGDLGAEGDAEFHHAIAVAARNEVLLRLIDAMADPIRESRVESLSEPGRPLRSLEIHRRIPFGIEAGSAKRSGEAMRQHLNVVADVSLLRWQPEPANGDD